MGTYEQNRDALEAEEAGKPVQLRDTKEPTMRRIQRYPGSWEWIVVPDDEYPAVVARAPATKPVRQLGHSTMPDASGNLQETDMSVRKADLLKGFEAREGTIREKVINVLVDNLNKPVAIKDLLKAGYGNQKDENVGALRNVLKGVDVMIEKNKLPVKLENQKLDDGTGAYGLFAG